MLKINEFGAAKWRNITNFGAQGGLGEGVKFGELPRFFFVCGSFSLPKYVFVHSISSPGYSGCIRTNRVKFRRMSETPTTTTSQKVLQYTSNLYCNTPPSCVAVLSLPLSSQEREILQYSSRLYRSAPLICIAVCLPFASQYFWENLGGCGHRDVAHQCIPLNFFKLHPVLHF